MTTTPDFAFSYPIDVVSLPGAGRAYDIEANATERAGVAMELGVETIDSLMASLTVVPTLGGLVEVTGRITAKVVQACVVTLQPLPSTIDEKIEHRFEPVAHVKPPPKEPAKKEGAKKASSKKAPVIIEDEEGGEGWVDPNAEIIDPIVDGRIDLGAVVTEHLSLMLDPYPRAPGASFATASTSETPQSEGDIAPENPFSALAKLKIGKAEPRRSTKPPKEKPGR